MSEFHANLAVQRVRHELKMRRVAVRRVAPLTPGVISITFAGPDLAGFVSASFDDHVKLILPAPGETEPALLVAGPNGLSLPEGAPRPTMRDYTPRRFDTVAGELDIEFALHGDGPAAAWAAQATLGQVVGIAGPRGSFLIPAAFDWHLLIGDDTALPAIARRLAELPEGKTALVLLAVAEADRRALPSRANVTLRWVEPGDQPLLSAVRALSLPAGEGYAWAAGEANAMAAVRAVLVDDLGVDRQRCRCAAYWKQGAAAHHENLQEPAAGGNGMQARGPGV